MQVDFDIEHCRWCKGDGQDHGTLGMPVVRDCPRCEGSGKVYVTSRESATGRRRVYKGPAPKSGVIAAQPQVFAPAKPAFPPSLAVTTELTERSVRSETSGRHRRDALGR